MSTTATSRLALVVFLHGASDPLWRARYPAGFAFWRDAAGLSRDRAASMTSEEAQTMLTRLERQMSSPDGIN
jgi:hypothetical protein